MSSLQLYQYEPDYAVHPGKILKEHLSARNMKQSDLARLCGLSAKHISQIISGNAPVTPETAIQLERVLGMSANIWNNLDADYRLHIAKEEERKRLSAAVQWLKQFPVRELKKGGFLPKSRDTVDIARGLLSFLGVGSFENWEASYNILAVSCRQSPAFKSSKESVAAWLRIGELMAENISTQSYDRDTFEESLRAIRALTRELPSVFEPRMRELCRQSGVALVFVAELPGTHLSGATRWLNRNKALIIQSLRYKKDDHFWFTFFHEAAHILLHGKNRKSLFIDDTKMDSSDKEDEANHFAANALIPEAKYLSFVSKGRFYEEHIVAFARQLGIAPGIVVGRLQYDRKIKPSWQNKLKRSFELVESTREDQAE
ncbi:MAG TPA: HigA family addiction module antitoxin [bacterium]|nr:HigA family addiction module antitoxin [bacterium]